MASDKLILRNTNFHPLARFINLKRFQLRRRKCVRDVSLGVRVPLDDIHLLIVQLANNILHPLAAQTRRKRPPDQL